MGTDGRRQRLKSKETRAALETLAMGSRLVVVKSLPLGDAGVARPGTDVTDMAKTWPMLRALVQRGYLKVVPAGEGMPAASVAPAAVPSVAPAPAAPAAALPPRRRRG